MDLALDSGYYDERLLYPAFVTYPFIYGKKILRIEFKTPYGFSKGHKLSSNINLNKQLTNRQSVSYDQNIPTAGIRRRSYTWKIIIMMSL